MRIEEEGEGARLRGCKATTSPPACYCFALMYLQMISLSPLPSVPPRPLPTHSPVGPKRLYLRRTLYLPKSPTDGEELMATNTQDGPHYMAFIDAVYNFLHGFYRFSLTDIAILGAMLLASNRGGFDKKRDTPEAIK